MISRRHARGRYVQPIFFRALFQRSDNLWMSGQPQIIAAGKIGEFAPAPAHESAVDLLERFGFGHGFVTQGLIWITSPGCKGKSFPCSDCFGSMRVPRPFRTRMISWGSKAPT